MASQQSSNTQTSTITSKPETISQVESFTTKGKFYDITFYTKKVMFIDKDYRKTKIKKYKIYKCSCPAFKFYKDIVENSTCKHIKKIRSEKKEKKRIKRNSKVFEKEPTGWMGTNSDSHDE